MTATLGDPGLATPGGELPDPRRPQGARPRRSVVGLLGPLVVGAVFIGVWYLLHYALMSENRRFLVPPPHRVIDKSFLTWEVRGAGTLAAIAGGGLHDQLDGLWLSA